MNKREQGKKNGRAVKRALGKRPLTLQKLSEKSGVEYHSARRHADKLVEAGTAVKARAGLEVTYALAPPMVTPEAA